MAQATSIEWAEHVWNPVSGCTRVSAGCDNCYAMHFAHRFSKVPGHAMEGLTVIRNNKVDWSGKIKLNEDTLLAPLRRKKPTRYFVNSMSDLFHHNVHDEYIDKVFAVMALCPQHTFMILTKRPERMEAYFESRDNSGALPEVIWIEAERILRSGVTCTNPPFKLWSDRVAYNDEPQDYMHGSDYTGNWPLPNVWLGVSVEDQSTAEERIPLLLQTPAEVRWVSAEPLIGPLNLYAPNDGIIRCRRGHFDYLHDDETLDPEDECGARDEDGAPCGAHFSRVPLFEGYHDDRLDWVVVGGESGPGARPFDLNWAKSILKQCREANVACFIKQLGSDPFYSMKLGTTFKFNNRKGGDMSEWPEDLRVREYPGMEVEG
jgi:protein gp37